MAHELTLSCSFGLPYIHSLNLSLRLKEAAPMILTGKEVRPDKAKKLGLVDLIVDPFARQSP